MDKTNLRNDKIVHSKEIEKYLEKNVLRLIKMLENNTCEENCFRSSNFDLYSQRHLSDTLAKWLKEPKKNRKQTTWNSLIFSLATLIMPDVEMNQLLISHQFFFEKMNYLLGLSTFKTDTLFNGVQIKINESFIAFDTQCKLQKVIIEGSQIKQITPTQAFTMIKRQDLTCQDRKKRLFIYNRQKYKNSTFLTVELKVVQKIKNQLFKEDHLNKIRFFTNYVFGEYCPSFCVSGINMLEIKENQWLDEKTHLHSANIFLIYSGTFVCFLQKAQKNNSNQGFIPSEVSADPKISSRVVSAKKSRRGLSTATSYSHTQDFISKIQLNKGSIIQSSSFEKILNKTNQSLIQKFQSCKSVSNSIIFSIKSSQFYRALCADERCMQYFMNQYQKVLISRKLMRSQSLQVLNMFFTQNQQQVNESQFNFSISRRKNYTGFRTTRSSKSNFEDMQNLATVGMYETMIKNKEKVLSIQKDYKEKNKSKQKTNFRYEDTKKIKENYKRMKIKDFQIQKLVFRNSVSNIKDPDGFKNVKSRFGQVKGIFEDQIEEVQKIINEQRKVVMDEEMNKENKVFKRKTTKMKSQSPETSNPSYLKQSLTYSRTCQNSKRVSLNEDFNEDMFREIHQRNKPRVEGSTAPMRNSKSTAMIDFKLTVHNMPSMFQCVVNGNHGHQQPKNYIFNSPRNENDKKKSVRRTRKKVKTFVKQQRKESNLKPSFNHTLSSLAI